MKFHGEKITGTQLEVLALQVEAEHRAREPDLMRSKWFDYRLMHPTTATYLFAQHYKNAVRTWAEKVHDVERAKTVRAFAPVDIFKSRDMTAMWLARASADALGMEYGLYLEMASARAHTQWWKTFPRPNQLYGEAIEIDLRTSYEELQQHQLQYSRAPWFKTPAFTGHALQVEHREHVARGLLARGGHPGALGRMFREQVLDPKGAGQWFSAELIEQAQVIAKKLAAQ